jgi:hypothetical protein
MKEKNSEYTLYVMGAFIGAIIGIIAAMLVEKSSENEGGDVHLTGRKLAKVGFGTISALWSLIDPGKGLSK